MNNPVKSPYKAVLLTGFASLLIAFACLVFRQGDFRPRTLRVGTYPYVPESEPMRLRIEQDFEKRHQDVRLEFVDLLSCVFVLWRNSCLFVIPGIKSGCAAQRLIIMPIPRHPEFAFRLHFIRFLVVALTLTSCCLRIFGQEKGRPFGPLNDADFVHLAALARTSGFDLNHDLACVYQDGQPVDAVALARVFRVSLCLRTMDSDARTYGQIIYNSLLNIGEVIGVTAYIEILDDQSADVQQRVRDILYYSMIVRVPKEHRKEAEEQTRKLYPTLFPDGFQFGFGDPLFAHTTSSVHAVYHDLSCESCAWLPLNVG